MSVLPAVNLRRTFLIARRDYLGYIKTWGFWISFLMPFIGMGFGIGFATLDVELSPPRYETILDETGEYADGILALHEQKQRRKVERFVEGLGAVAITEAQEAEILETLEQDGSVAAKAKIEQVMPSMKGQLKSLDSKFNFVDPPAETLAGSQDYLTGESLIEVDGKARPLDGLLYITQTEEGPKADYWSKNINASDLKNLAADYFENRAEANYLASGSLTPEGLAEAKQGRLEVESFDPTKIADETTSQAVSQADKVPYYVAAGLSAFLWLSVFSGAYMLLTSMLEEKLNKLLEMMLASTRFSEIIFGKLLGVAALTLTAMAPYILLAAFAGTAIALKGDSEMTQAFTQSFTPKLLIFFFIFLILGYIFYGACFIALGALSQSMQDAQTMTTPIVIVLTLCVLVVPLGLATPDSPLLRLASLFPLSAPFAVLVRLPSDPPLWELILSAVLLALLSLGVVWAAGRVFRYGVLSGSGMNAITGWFKRTVLRQS